MRKFWKVLTWACCFCCGSDCVSVHTTMAKDDWAYDGDRLRCEECGALGWISTCCDSNGDEWDAEHDEEQTK